MLEKMAADLMASMVAEATGAIVRSSSRGKKNPREIVKTSRFPRKKARVMPLMVGWKTEVFNWLEHSALP
jgi:hypothetical protein